MEGPDRVRVRRCREGLELRADGGVGFPCFGGGGRWTSPEGEMESSLPCSKSQREPSHGVGEEAERAAGRS